MGKKGRTMLKNTITVNEETCRKCGLCSEACPNKIIKKNDSGEISFRQDRIQFCFKCGQCMAICPTESILVEDLSYSKDFVDIPESESFDKSFFNMILTRRAVRNFKDKPVPRELLEKIVQAMAFAPPGFPPIKTEIVVVQDTTLIRKALPHMINVFDFLVKAMANPMMRFFIKRRVGREKFNLLVHHVVPLMKNRLPELKMGVEDTITRNAPAMILFHANRNSENYREDIYVALTYGFLAAHALGLGGSAMDIIPPPIERNKELRKMFLIPDTNKVVASMILGYPKYRYERAIKRELKSVKWI
jgi:ferredoxin